MKRKFRISLFWAVCLVAAFFCASLAIAIEPNPILKCSPNGITNFDDFVNSVYFNEDENGDKCVPINSFDFEQLYYVTAIAKEAGHVNFIEFDGFQLFSTNNCSLWGLYGLIDFSLTNLNFVDSNTEDSTNLDPFCTDPENLNCNRLKVCQLTANSNPLGPPSGYLSYPTQLLKGDFIVGFEDSTDNDFDDLIVVLRALNSKENPRFFVSKDNSNEKFEGEGFCFEWTDNLSCKAIVKGCSCEEECANIPGEPLADIFILKEDDNENSGTPDPAVFFGSEAGACKPVYIKFDDGSVCAVIGDRVYCKPQPQND